MREAAAASEALALTPPVVNAWQSGLALAELCRPPPPAHSSSHKPVHKLNAQQVAAVLQTFWPDVLQNNVRGVKKTLAAHHLAMDFNAARYRPSADGTALHLCAQHGFLATAQLLLDVGLDVDAQNKVGLTPLHVACKCQQRDAVVFLLNRGARVDVPDNQGHTAFDVAPFAVLDRCVLQPWREKVAELELLHREATAACDAAQQDFDDACAANERTLMVIADCESRVVEESLLLEDERSIEQQWVDRLREAEQALANQRAECEQYERQLEVEAEELAATWRDQLQTAQDENADAVELLAQATALVERTESELETRRLALDRRCGLLHAAREFPNDEDVQNWMLSSIRGLADDLGRESEPLGDLVPLEDPLDPLAFLFREESVRVVLEAMIRFATTHRVQVQALQCIVVLVRTSQRLAKDETVKPTSPGNRFRPPTLEQFASLLLRCDVLAALQAALVTFEGDLELYELGFELLHHLLSYGCGATPPVLQFCQDKRNQLLPLRFVELLDGCESRDRDSRDAGPEISLAASRAHAAHLLFVLTKHNVEKALLDAGVVRFALTQIDRTLSDASDRITDDALSHATLAIRHFLAALAILHSIASPSEQRRTRTDAARTLDGSLEWEQLDVQSLVDRLQRFLSRVQMLPAARKHVDEVRYWLLQLLRSLVWHRGAVAERIRADLASLTNVQLVAELVCCVDSANPSRDGMATNIAETGLELVDVVWIRRYDDEGRLLATPEVVLDLLVTMLEDAVRGIEGSRGNDAILRLLGSTMDVLAVVATNGASHHRPRSVVAATQTDLHLCMPTYHSNEPSSSNEAREHPRSSDTGGDGVAVPAPRLDGEAGASAVCFALRRSASVLESLPVRACS